MPRVFFKRRHVLEPSLVGFLHHVPQSFLLQFNHVHLESLVAGMDLIHLPTAAWIRFDQHLSLRFLLPVKWKPTIDVNFQTFRVCDES